MDVRRTGRRHSPVYGASVGRSGLCHCANEFLRQGGAAGLLDVSHFPAPGRHRHRHVAAAAGIPSCCRPFWACWRCMSPSPCPSALACCVPRCSNWIWRRKMRPAAWAQDPCAGFLPGDPSRRSPWPGGCGHCRHADEASRVTITSFLTTARMTTLPVRIYAEASYSLESDGFLHLDPDDCPDRRSDAADGPAGAAGPRIFKKR